MSKRSKRAQHNAAVSSDTAETLTDQTGNTPPAEIIPVQLVEDAHGNVAFQHWLQSALEASVGGETLLARVARVLGHAVNGSFRVNRGFTSRMAMADPGKMLLCEVIWANSEGTRGRFVAPEDAGKQTKDSSGPRVSDNRDEIIINIRAGSGQNAIDRKVTYLTALAHGLLLIGRGEPTTDSVNRQRTYGGDYWTVAEKLGFDPTKKADKFALTSDFKTILRQMAEDLPDVPVGSLDLATAAKLTGSDRIKRLSVACPYDLRDDAPKVNSAEMQAAIERRDIHMSAQMSVFYNKVGALPFCPEKSHPKSVEIDGETFPLGKGPIRLVMFKADKDELRIYQPGEDVNPAPTTSEDTAPEAETPEPLTGTGGPQTH
jgi:hypothetical protein